VGVFKSVVVLTCKVIEHSDFVLASTYEVVSSVSLNGCSGFIIERIEKLPSPPSPSHSPSYPDSSLEPWSLPLQQDVSLLGTRSTSPPPPRILVQVDSSISDDDSNQINQTSVRFSISDFTGPLSIDAL
jgi:hypothetical protein